MGTEICRLDRARYEDEAVGPRSRLRPCLLHQAKRRLWRKIEHNSQQKTFF